MSKKNSKDRLIMNKNGNNHLMNTLIYDALKSAGVKEEEARATALEAGNNDLRFLAIEHAFDKLYSHVDKTAAELQRDMANLRTDIIENQNRNASRQLENENRNASRQLENENRQLENANRNSRSNLTIILAANAVSVGWISILLVFFV